MVVKVVRSTIVVVALWRRRTRRRLEAKIGREHPTPAALARFSPTSVFSHTLPRLLLFLFRLTFSHNVWVLVARHKK
jgi:hypothetical protein